MAEANSSAAHAAEATPAEAPPAQKKVSIDLGGPSLRDQRLSKWGLVKKAKVEHTLRDSRTSQAVARLSLANAPAGAAIKEAVAALKEARKKQGPAGARGSLGMSPEGSASVPHAGGRENWKQMLAEAEGQAQSAQREVEHNTAEIFTNEREAAALTPKSQIDPHISFVRSNKDEAKAMAVVKELLDSEDKYRTDIGRTLEFLKPLVEVF